MLFSRTLAYTAIRLVIGDKHHRDIPVSEPNIERQQQGIPAKAIRSPRIILKKNVLILNILSHIIQIQKLKKKIYFF